MPLSPNELQRMRDAHTATLTSTCSVWRKVQATNSTGGPNDTWQEQIASVPCRLMPEQSRRRLEVAAEREVLVTYFRLTVPYNTDIRADDRVIFGGETYQIAALWDSHDLRTARRAILSKVV